MNLEEEIQQFLSLEDDWCYKAFIEVPPTDPEFARIDIVALRETDSFTTAQVWAQTLAERGYVVTMNPYRRTHCSCSFCVRRGTVADAVP